MHDPPAYVWAIIIAGPTAIAATTWIALYGGAKRAGQGRMRAALLARATAGLLGGWFTASAVIAGHGWHPHAAEVSGTATISAHGSFAGKLAVATGGGSGMGRQLVRQLAGQGRSVAAGDWHKDAVADGAARTQAGAGPGVRVTDQADDVSGEAQVLRFGDEPVMVPIRHLASTVPAHTWTFRPAGHGRRHGRHGLLAAHPGYRTVFLVTAALILPTEFPHSVSDPGQCTRARPRRRTCAGRSRRVIRDG